MKLGVLFSGGKDSTYAAYLAKQQGHELTCLITVYSENPDSYMFHTPSIEKTKHQAEVMNLPLLVDTTKGKKEEELVDLERVIKTAIDKYGIEGITTGALYSDYQATRIQKICDKLGLKFINPLWHKDEFQYLNELIKDNFKVIIIGTAAEGLDQSWLGREINQEFIEDVDWPKKQHSKSFYSQLEGAQELINIGDIEAAIEKLNDFINHVEAQSGKKISTDDAGVLTEYAYNLINSLDSTPEE